MESSVRPDDAKTMTGIVCGRRHLSEQQFIDACGRAAAGYRAMGFKRGDTVALLMRNDAEFLVAQSAATLIGCHAVPLNWHSSPQDIAFILADSSAGILVAHADLVPAIRPLLDPAICLIVVPTPDELLAAYDLPAAAGTVDAGDMSWPAWLAHFEPLPVEDFARGGGLGIFYTSGTTGRPKGVEREPLDPESAAKLQRVVNELFGLTHLESARILVPAPIYHGAPNFFANRGAAPGSLCVLQPRFEAEQLLALVARHAITHLYMVPTTMLKLLELPEEIRSKYDLSSLQRVIHSAAPCPPDVKRRMIEWLGPVVYEFYGGTECGTITLLGPLDALEKPGSVGRLLADCALKVCGDDGKELPTGEVGEIYARNFNTPRFSYRHLAEKQSEVELGELVSIGDVGYLDEDGFLFLCDRKRDMVISAGVNIYPAEIEAALIMMPEIADCIVFGIPDPTYGERLCAHVEPKPGRTVEADSVVAWLEGRLARYQVPRKIVIDDGLPREESGKIMKRRVRDRYWQTEARQI
ncbi:long-chain acyl-CoA synthetase [Sphingopyxis sp. OAS728]|uniref:AMP-binding protein n=1 Tax=Sphingopyxis sp. OAS728 TaxID=2663823 RepID=UPI001788FFFF|nr:AMP-binding protein [Sphingopyxis sp. OAS728]MBE1527988.1 long-chain acyl-CoA synthetase [Sphingopyxis sp. OAS728]